VRYSIKNATVAAVDHSGTKFSNSRHVSFRWQPGIALRRDSRHRWIPSLTPKDPFVGGKGSLRIEAQADESLQILLNIEPGLSGALTVKDFRRERDAYQQSAPDAKKGPE
jgi:hypothetical protein